MIPGSIFLFGEIIRRLTHFSPDGRWLRRSFRRGRRRGGYAGGRGDQGAHHIVVVPGRPLRHLGHRRRVAHDRAHGSVHVVDFGANVRKGAGLFGGLRRIVMTARLQQQRATSATLSTRHSVSIGIPQVAYLRVRRPPWGGAVHGVFVVGGLIRFVLLQGVVIVKLRRQDLVLLVHRHGLPRHAPLFERRRVAWSICNKRALETKLFNKVTRLGDAFVTWPTGRVTLFADGLSQPALLGEAGRAGARRRGVVAGPVG